MKYWFMLLALLLGVIIVIYLNRLCPLDNVSPEISNVPAIIEQGVILGEDYEY